MSELNGAKRVSRRGLFSSREEKKQKTKVTATQARHEDSQPLVLDAEHQKALEKQKSRFQELQTKHQTHLERLEALTKDIITADDITAQMKEIEAVKLDIKACQATADEIKKYVAETLEKQARAESARLPETRETFNREFERASLEAGECLSKAIMILRQIGFTYSDVLSKKIMEAYEEVMRIPGNAKLVPPFQRGFTNGMNAPLDSRTNFKKERARLDEIDRLGKAAQKAFWKKTDVFLGLFDESGQWPWQPLFEEWVRLYPESEPARRFRASKKPARPLPAFF